MTKSKRIKSVLIVAVLIVVISVSGCTSIQARLEGVPVWVIGKPANTLSKVYFVSQGTSDVRNTMTARQYAYEDLLDTLSDYLGYSVREKYRRELLQTEAIAELGLVVTDEFVQETDSVNTVYILTESNRKMISKLVRDNLNTVKEDENKIKTPETEAQTAYRKQDDFQAFSLYIQAALEAYKSPLAEAEQRYSGLMQNAIDVLDGLRFEVVSSDSAKGVFTARVTRGSGVFAPRISGMPVRAVFLIKNSTGNTRQEELHSKTDNKGTVTFSPNHITFRGSGILTMYLDIQDVLSGLSTEVGNTDPYVKQLRSIVTEKSLEFSYAIKSQIAGSVVVASMLEYDKSGTLLDQSSALDAMIETMKADGIFANMIISGTSYSSEDALLERAEALYADSRTIAVIGSAGISSVVESGGSYIASVKGSVRAYSLKDGSVFAASGELAANAIGETSALARDAAFRRFGQVAASLMIGKLL